MEWKGENMEWTREVLRGCFTTFGGENIKCLDPHEVGSRRNIPFYPILNTLKGIYVHPS